MSRDLYRDLAYRIAEEEGVYGPLVESVIHQESKWRPDAVSVKGAQGLMQLMPATAKALGVEDPFDPEQNIRGGVVLLKQNLLRHKDDISLALADYNAGPTAVKRHGGIPPYPETQDFVEQVQNVNLPMFMAQYESRLQPEVPVVEEAIEAPAAQEGTWTLTLPDRSTVPAPIGMSRAEALGVAKGLYPESFKARARAPVSTEDSSVFDAYRSAAVKAAGSLVPAVQAAIAIATGKEEDFDIAVGKLKEEEDAARKIAPNLVTLEEVGEVYEKKGVIPAVSKFIEHGVETIFGSFGFQTPAIGGAALTYGALSVPAIAAAVPAAVTAGVGAVVVGGGLMLANYLGENLGRAYEEGKVDTKDYNLLSQIAYAGGQTALDSLTYLLAGGKVGTQMLFSKEARDIGFGAVGKLLNKLDEVSPVKAILAVMAEEQVAEVGQQALERHAAGLPISPAHEEARDEYVQIFLSTLIPSLAFGGVRGLSSKMSRSKARRLEEGYLKSDEDRSKVTEAQVGMGNRAMAQRAESDQALRVTEREEAIEELSRRDDVTPEEIHALAAERNINSEDLGFHMFSHRKTEEAYLDGMSQEQLQKVYVELASFPKQDVPISLQVLTDEELRSVAGGLRGRKKRAEIGPSEIRNYVYGKYKISPKRMKKAFGNQLEKDVLQLMQYSNLLEKKDGKYFLTEQPGKKLFSEEDYQKVIDVAVSRSDGRFPNPKEVENETGIRNLDSFRALREAAVRRGDVVLKGNRYVAVEFKERTAKDIEADPRTRVIGKAGYLVEETGKKKRWVVRDDDGEVVGQFPTRDKAVAFQKSKEGEPRYIVRDSGEPVSDALSRQAANQRIKGIVERESDAEYKRAMSEGTDGIPGEDAVSPSNLPLLEMRAKESAERVAKATRKRLGRPAKIARKYSSSQEEGFLVREDRFGRDGRVRKSVVKGFFVDEVGAQKYIAELEALSAGKDETAARIQRGVDREIAPQVVSEQDKKFAEVEEILNSVMRSRVLNKFRVQLVEFLESGAAGEFSAATRIIRLALNPELQVGSVDDQVAAVMRTLNHETIHVYRKLDLVKTEEWKQLSNWAATTLIPEPRRIGFNNRVAERTNELEKLLKDGSITEAQYRAEKVTLVKMETGATYLDQARIEYKTQGIKENWREDSYVEEAVAAMAADWNPKVAGEAPKQVKGIFRKIAATLKRIGRALARRGFETPADLFDHLFVGREMAMRAGRGRALDTWWSNRRLGGDQVRPEADFADLQAWVADQDKPITGVEVAVRVPKVEVDEPEARRSLARDVLEQGELPGERPLKGAFHSALGRALRQSPQRDMTLKQLRAYLEKKKVKKDEIIWSGLDEYFEMAGLTEWLAKNPGTLPPGGTVGEVKINLDTLLNLISFVTVEEQVLGGFIRLTGEERSELDRLDEKYDNNDLTPGEAFRRAELHDVESGYASQTRYEGYVLPGGKNYRETLITLPRPSLRKTLRLGGTRDDYNAAVEAAGPAFEGGHYRDVPNILVHVRHNERTGPNGERILFIEEIQDDWAKAGRDEGYAGLSEAEREELASLQRQYRVSEMDIPAGATLADYTIITDRIKELQSRSEGIPDRPFKKDSHVLALKRMIAKAANEGFDEVAWTTGLIQVERYEDVLRQVVDEIKWESEGVTSLDSDDDVIDQYVRRQMNYWSVGRAGDGEYVIHDPNGELLHDYGGGIEKWADLDGAVSHLQWMLEEDAKRMGEAELRELVTTRIPSDRVLVSASKDDANVIEMLVNRETGRVTASTEVEAFDETLESIVGKKIATQILQDEAGSITGEGLTIGGKGLIDIYDKQLVQAANKIGKQFGAKVGRTQIIADESAGRYYAEKSGDGWLVRGYAQQVVSKHYTSAGAEAEVARLNVAELTTVHSLPITAKMSESVKEEGLPLFQGEGDPRASVEFIKDGKAIIRGFENSDVTSGVHELAHVARRRLFNRDIPVGDRIGITDTDIDTVERWAGVKDGVWGRKSEEKFSRGFERYIQTGKAPTKNLQSLFDRLANWFREIYQMLSGPSISPEMTEVFDRLVQRGPGLEAQSLVDKEAEVSSIQESLDIPAHQAEAVQAIRVATGLDPGILYVRGEAAPRAGPRRSLARDVGQPASIEKAATDPSADTREAAASLLEGAQRSEMRGQEPVSPFLTPDGSGDRLKRRANRLKKPKSKRAGLPSQKAFRKRTLKLKDGSVISVGQISPSDWANRIASVFSKEEIEAARAWYREVQPAFEGIFAEDFELWAASWLMAQQNESPSGAMQNVLRVREQVGTGVDGKQGGLADYRLREFWRAVMSGDPDAIASIRGMSQKLLDFVDSALGKTTRTWMNNDPAGREPVVIDVHTARDVGFVDETLLKHLSRLVANPRQLEGVVVDMRGAPTEARYEYGVDFLHNVRDHLNKNKLFGGGFERVAEIQAIGWMAILKQLGLPADTAPSSIAKSERRLSTALAFGKGAPWSVQYGELLDLDFREQLSVTESVTGFAVTEAGSLLGYPPIVSIETQAGGWMDYPGEPSTQVIVLSTDEVADDMAEVLGFLLQQDEVRIERPLELTVSGNIPDKANEWFIDLVDEGATLSGHYLNDPGIQMLFWDKIREHAPELMGFHPINDNGFPGIRIGLSMRDENGKTNRWNGKRGLGRIESELVPKLWKAIEVLEADLGTPLDMVVQWMPGEARGSTNNWKENPDGTAYRQRLEEKYGPGIQADLDSSRSRVEAALVGHLERVGAREPINRPDLPFVLKRNEREVKLGLPGRIVPEPARTSGTFPGTGEGRGFLSQLPPHLRDKTTGRTPTPSAGPRRAVGEGASEPWQMTREEFEESEETYFHGSSGELGVDGYMGAVHLPGRVKLHPGDIGTWFAMGPKGKFTAGEFAEKGASRRGESPRVDAVRLDLKNPKIYETYEDFLEGVGSFKSGVNFQKKLIREGHDGIIIKESSTDSGLTRQDAVAFRNDQIKTHGDLVREAQVEGRSLTPRAAPTPEVTEEIVTEISTPTKRYSFRDPLESDADLALLRPGTDGIRNLRNVTWGHLPFNRLGKPDEKGVVYNVHVKRGHHEVDSITVRGKGYGERHIELHNENIQKNTPFTGWQDLLTGFLTQLSEGPRKMKSGEIYPDFRQEDRGVFLWDSEEFKNPVVVVMDYVDKDNGEVLPPKAHHYSVVTMFADDKYGENMPKENRRGHPALHGPDVSTASVMYYRRPNVAKRWTESERKRFALDHGVPLTPAQTAAMTDISGEVPNPPTNLWERISKGFTVFDSDWWSKLNTAVLDKYYRLERLGLLVKGAGLNVQEQASASAYALALMVDKAGLFLSSALQHGVMSFKDGLPMVVPLELTNTGEYLIYDKKAGEYRRVTRTKPTLYEGVDGKAPTGGMQTILGPLAIPTKNLIPMFFNYSRALRGKRLKEDGIEVDMSDASIKEAIAFADQYPEIGIAHTNLQNWNNGMVQFLKDTGVMTDKMVKVWLEHSDYVPFYLNLDDQSNAYMSEIFRREFGSKDRRILDSLIGTIPSERIKGRPKDSNFMEPIEAITKNAMALIQNGLKNAASLKAIDESLLLGQATKMDDSSKATVTVRRNGVQEHYYLADPLLHDTLVGAFDGLNPDGWLEAAAAPARWLREAVTRSPGFMIANNLRDSLNTWLQGGGSMTSALTGVSNFGKSLKGMAFSEEKTETYKLMEMTGAIGGGYEYAGVAPKALKRMYLGKIGEKKNAMAPLRFLWDKLAVGTWDKLGEASAYSEAAARQGVFETTYNATLKKQQALLSSSKEDQDLAHRRAIREAGFQATEVLNFGRRGNNQWVKIVAATVPFMNARVQGLRRLARSGTGRDPFVEMSRGEAARNFAIRGGLLATMTMIYTMLSWDDEEYQAMDAYIRDDNWLIPLPWGGFVAMPIPFEVGVLFKVIPEQIVRLSLGAEPRATVDTAIHAIGQTLNLVPVPQFLKPIGEGLVNYNAFTGNPIVPTYMLKSSAELQKRPSTPTAAVAIGSLTGVSPLKVENFIRSQFGTMGTYAMTLVDYATHNPVFGFPVMPFPRVTQFPIIKRFFKEELGRGNTNLYYDLRGEIETVTADVRELSKSEPLKALERLEEGRTLLEMKPLIKIMDKKLKMIRDQRKAIWLSRDISTGSKNKMISDLDKYQNQILRDVPLMRRMADMDLF